MSYWVTNEFLLVIAILVTFYWSFNFCLEQVFFSPFYLPNFLLVLCFPLPSQPDANKWTKSWIEGRRCPPLFKCPVAWRLLLIAEVKKVFHNHPLVPASLPAPFPWSLERKCELIAFQCKFSFWSHTWILFLSWVEYLSSASWLLHAICWDIQRACGEQTWQKLFRHFAFPLLWKHCCSVHAHTPVPLTLLTQWLKMKFRYLGVETSWNWNIGVSVQSTCKFVCGICSPYSQHMTKLLCVSGVGFFHFMCILCRFPPYL